MVVPRGLDNNTISSNGLSEINVYFLFFNLKLYDKLSDSNTVTKIVYFPSHVFENQCNVTVLRSVVCI